MDMPERKPNRLKEYDYSQAGAYFITVCVKDKRKMFWSNAALNNILPGEEIHLSNTGLVVETAINNISVVYPNVRVDKYVVMPDHIHMILQITADNISGRTVCAPTISRIIKQMKEYVTKQTGECIWQKSLYDHIIRNDHDYREIWEYIDTNPLKRKDDDKQMK
jgi:REP element-mobilizing transposase RayT